MKHVFAAKDVNYASSVGDTAVNTALNPYDLADGAVGIYGVHGAAGVNINKLVLLIDGGAEAAGVVPAANFVGDQILFAIGTSDRNKPIVSNSIQVDKMRMTTAAYQAAVRGVFGIGYALGAAANGQDGNGDLNLPASIFRGDEAWIKLNYLDDKDELKTTGCTYSGYASKIGDDEFSILNDLAENYDRDEQNGRVAIEVVVQAGTITDFATNPTVTNGSPNVTFAGAETINVGDVVIFRGRAYEVAEVVSGTEINLTRNYQGASETITTGGSLAGIVDVSTITASGLRIFDLEDNMETVVANGGIIESADRTQIVAAEFSNGEGAQVAFEELSNRPYHGGLNNIDRRIPLRNLYTDEDVNYDQYELLARNSHATSDPHTGGPQGASSTEVGVMFAFVEGVADTPGFNQSDFEDIMTALGVSFVSLL